MGARGCLDCKSLLGIQNNTQANQEEVNYKVVHFPERASSSIPTSDVATGDTTQGEPLQRAQGTMQSPKSRIRNLLYCHGVRLYHCYPGGFYNQYGLVTILCFSLSHFLTNSFYCFYSVPSPLP